VGRGCVYICEAEREGFRAGGAWWEDVGEVGDGVNLRPSCAQPRSRFLRLAPAIERSNKTLNDGCAPVVHHYLVHYPSVFMC
jgi:hypothetical protein